MQKLILVESPTKARTLSQILGKEYRVLASMGHVRDLPKGTLGVDVENDFKPQYVIPTKARKNVNLLKKETAQAKETILATDEDREGESIAWHLAQVLGLKNAERIVFHEITKGAILEALRNPRRIDTKLVHAQQTRRVLDRLVGYKLSPFLWRKVASKLSAGRVQSVAVRLVVDREREIKTFKPQEYWSIEATFRKIQNPKSKNQNENSKLKNKFRALLTKKDDRPIGKFDLKNKEDANATLKDLEGAEYRVVQIEKKETRKNPLPPFTTSTLQQTASQRLRFPAVLTMRVAQQLYETGLITYHRTDSLNLAESSLSPAKAFIEKEYGRSYWPGTFRRFRTKSKGAQEAHEAIRPTNVMCVPGTVKLALQQAKLYNLIWRRFLASQMAQAIFDSSAVEVEAHYTPYSIAHALYTFRATGQVQRFDGFLRVYSLKFEEVDLPMLEEREILELKELLPQQHFTQPPPRYNEATLIKALESYGIGRPSTYAPILSTIQERNYVEKDEQRRLRPTEMGIAVNDLLVEHFPKIVDVIFTAEMEEDLDTIAQGKKEWVPTVREFYEPFAQNLAKKEKEVPKQTIQGQVTNRTCRRCGKPLLIRLSRYGKFYACSGFPECTYTASLEEQHLHILCPKCKEGQLVEKRTKRKKTFYGCDQYPKCDFALWDKPTGQMCKQCGSLLIQRGKHTRCSNPKCALGLIRV